MTDDLRELRHDLRSPVQTIINAVYMIENHPELTPKMLQIIRSALDQEREMLEDPLDVVRSQEIQFSVFIEQILKNTIVPEKIEIITRIKHEQFFFDRIKMRRVINNLVKNAIEAMPDGGKITVSSKKQKYKEVIEVTDNGPGIPPEILQGLFLNEQTTKPNGNGIGLISCRKIVEAHRGTIKVKSKEGKGTTFIISLPSQPNNPS